MDVTIIGTGYVGLVTGACFAEFGANVACADVDAAKIAALRAGRMPIYEPGLEDLVVRGAAHGRLSFTSECRDAIRGADAVFIAVGTPAREDGATDLAAVEAVAREIGRSLERPTVVVTKSTVPVGTARRVRGWIHEELARRGVRLDVGVASNPEFLREGAAVRDFLHPDRVVLGTEDARSLALLKELYRPLFLNETPFVLCDVATAELTKYAANAFLATKISFINEIANLCERLGADVQGVAGGIGLDGRIGPKFLHAGPGFGGSCFPKDTRSAARCARDAGESLEIVEAVIRVNERQRLRMVEKIEAVLGGSVRSRTIAVLGLSFKPETDDLREAPALSIIQELQSRGALVRAHDPVALSAASRLLPALIPCKSPYEACEGADALVLATEWNEYRMLDLARVRAVLEQPRLIDLRNVYDPEPVRALGFEYVGVGR